MVPFPLCNVKYTSAFQVFRCAFDDFYRIFTAEQGVIPWVPALVGFLLGIVFLLLIDTLTPHLHLASDKPEGVKSGFSKTTMMLLAVTIHNIPFNHST